MERLPILCISTSSCSQVMHISSVNKPDPTALTASVLCTGLASLVVLLTAVLPKFFKLYLCAVLSCHIKSLTSLFFLSTTMFLLKTELWNLHLSCVANWKTATISEIVYVYKK